MLAAEQFAAVVRELVVDRPRSGSAHGNDLFDLTGGVDDVYVDAKGARVGQRVGDGRVRLPCDRRQVQTTDVIGILADILPRSVRLLLTLLLCFGLVTGLATPLVRWFVETKAAGMTQDLTPVLDKMLKPLASTPTP